MAGGANLNLEVFDGGTGFYHVAAGAAYLCHLVFGMNLRFHTKSSVTKTPLINSGASRVH